MATDLSPAKCVLLTVHYASESNIKALHSFTPTRLDALEPELVLRILLTYLPESLDPHEYSKYVEEVASRLYLDVDREQIEVDTSPVNDIDDEQARKKVKKLKLLDIIPPSFPPGAPKDLLTRFLCHRSYRIDSETGLLNLVPQLVEPFLSQNEFLRTWYISVVLPLLRMEFEYYPNDERVSLSLRDFEKLQGREGIHYLLQKAEAAKDTDSQKCEVGRDVKGLIGPWMYGHTERKRRKLSHEEKVPVGSEDTSGLSNQMRKISLDGVTPETRTGHDWEYMYRWMVFQARENFPLIVNCLDDWDGPGDVDLGGLNTGNADRYLDEDTQSKLEAQYAQAAFASCYAVQTDTQQSIQGAHNVLARLAELLDFIPPPDLATSVESLPRVERHATLLDKSQTLADLEPHALLKPEHPLTTPRLETYMLLQMMVYSAYQFSGLGYPISLVNVAKLHFYAPEDEQIAVLQKLLRWLSGSGARKDETQWTSDRAKLMWLWNWGIDADNEPAANGAGVLGKIKREKFEEEMLKCFTETSSYNLAISLYLKSPRSALSPEKVERVVLGKAMEAYDGATNGNKTRGGMKKANDVIAAFRPFFSRSIRFQQASALISATHALSFYSLTLHHGVPFQPVSIRVSQDPIGLIDRVLEQNPGSYTKLDDIVDIGRNLVAAGLPQKRDSDSNDGEISVENSETTETKKKDAERRVTFMCIEAALREDDFETAYSYIVSRLTPSGADIEAPSNGIRAAKHRRNISKSSIRSTDGVSEDDISWRAAFLAGRYRPATSSPPSLRRLEQRTELLSLALLLAPVSALTEILTAWRRCEEEMTSLQVAQQQAEEDFDTWADKRQSMSSLPGNFSLSDQPAMVLNQQRREMGRMTGAGSGNSDAPVSMFDLTRSAAQAFSRNAFPLTSTTRSSSGHEATGMEESTETLESDGGDGQRVRRRDMVANAVSGGLASGIGWMLGATPVGQQQKE